MRSDGAYATGQLDLFGSTIVSARRDIERLLTPPGCAAVDCPVCGQRVKLHTRRLHRGMAAALMRLLGADEDQPNAWVDYRNAKAAGEGRDHTLLRFWSFIEADEDRPGFWRITPAGRDFALGLTSAPRAAYVYDNRCYGFTEGRITMPEALHSRGFRRDEVDAAQEETAA